MVRPTKKKTKRKSKKTAARAVAPVAPPPDETPPAEGDLRSHATYKIFPRNLTALAEYLVPGNPVITRPEDAVANCFPGLEIDIRNLDRRFFPKEAAVFSRGSTRCESMWCGREPLPPRSFRRRRATRSN